MSKTSKMLLLTIIVVVIIIIILIGIYIMARRNGTIYSQPEDRI